MAQIAKGSEEYLGNGRMRVTRVSVFSGIERTVELPISPEHLYSWRNLGLLIQDAMPQLTDSEREFMLTGASEDEWETLKEKDEE
jgi:hypothetical protein